MGRERTDLPFNLMLASEVQADRRLTLAGLGSAIMNRSVGDPQFQAYAFRL
jgi:hypothetical protein